MQPVLTLSRRRARSTAVALVALALLAMPAAAQESPAGDTTASAAEPVRPAVPRHLSAWVAVSSRVPMKSPGGVVHGSLVALGASMSWTLQQGPVTSLRYRVDVMPVMLFSEVAVARAPRCTSGDCVPRSVERDQVFAAGVVPLALELGTPSEWKAGVVVYGSGGVVVSRHPIPYPTTSSFNFLAAAGVSAHVRLTERVALTGGVQRAHISNGKLRPDNPGMDYTTWQLGLRY